MRLLVSFLENVYTTGAALVAVMWWDAVSDEVEASIFVGVAAAWAVIAGQVREHKLRLELAGKLSLVIGRGAPYERDKPTVTPIQNVVLWSAFPLVG